jgi:hypothetical protein
VLHHDTACAYCEDGVKVLTKFYNLPRHGPQGIHNEASNAIVENEFGTSNNNKAIMKILDQGEIQENIVCNPCLLYYHALGRTWLTITITQNAERQGIRNESQGPRGIR